MATRRRPRPQADTDHTISLLVEIPVFGPVGGKPDLSMAARIMDMIQQSVHTEAEGQVVHYDADGEVMCCTPIPSFASIIGKD